MAELTPGSFLRENREFAALSIEDVAMRISTEPHVDVRSRADLVRQIEADEAPIGAVVIGALRHAFPFDVPYLVRLLDAKLGEPGEAETEPVDDEEAEAAPSPDDDGAEARAAA